MKRHTYDRVSDLIQQLRRQNETLKSLEGRMHQLITEYGACLPMAGPFAEERKRLQRQILHAQTRVETITRDLEWHRGRSRSHVGETPA